jgi:Dirigent-like protein
MKVRLAALLAVVVGGLAMVAPAASLERPTTIRVVSSLTKVRQVDRPPKGRANPGDAVVTDSRLQNQIGQFGRKQGAVVGTDRATLRLLRDGSLRIFGTATLPGGTIRFDGRVTDSAATVVIRVVGGSGRYENARGTVTVTNLDDRGSALNVYRLVPGGADVA